MGQAADTKRSGSWCCCQLHGSSPFRVSRESKIGSSDVYVHVRVSACVRVRERESPVRDGQHRRGRQTEHQTNGPWAVGRCGDVWLPVSRIEKKVSKVLGRPRYKHNLKLDASAHHCFFSFRAFSRPPLVCFFFLLFLSSSSTCCVLICSDLHFLFTIFSSPRLLPPPPNAALAASSSRARNTPSRTGTWWGQHLPCSTIFPWNWQAWARGSGYVLLQGHERVRTAPTSHHNRTSEASLVVGKRQSVAVPSSGAAAAKRASDWLCQVKQAQCLETLRRRSCRACPLNTHR